MVYDIEIANQDDDKSQVWVTVQSLTAGNPLCPLLTAVARQPEWKTPAFLDRPFSATTGRTFYKVHFPPNWSLG